MGAFHRSPMKLMNRDAKTFAHPVGPPGSIGHNLYLDCGCSCGRQEPRQERQRDSGLPTYHSTVSEVRVTFFATDENNHPLDNLTKSDFAVVDSERIVRNFRSFTHSDETALDLLVLVDTSESVAPRFRIAINDVLQLVAKEQSIADDNLRSIFLGGGPMEDGRGRLLPNLCPQFSARVVAALPTPEPNSRQ